MPELTLIFLSLLLAGTAFRLWLAARQLRTVGARRDAVPPPFDTRISLEQHRKAADYTAARTRLGIVDTLLDVALLLLWTLGGGLQLLDTLWRDLLAAPLASGVGVLLSLMLVSAALTLPLSLIRTFGIEARFGFNKTTPALFVADLLKSLALSLLIGAPLITLILWFMRESGALWWLYAWLAWVGFALLMSWAYPALIAPLFNRFTPLQDESLRQRIDALLQRCGFRSKGVFVMDGSRRSAHGNAYFTGIGNNKRIVFFDTLMSSLEPVEIEAVLAHELGHFRRHHVRKRLLTMFTLSLAGLALLGWLKGQPWFYHALGISQPSDHAALALFLLVSPVFTFPFTPMGAWLSRRHEFEADQYAAEQSDGRALIRALVKLYRDNATTLTPDPVHSGFYDSHPPAPLRVARLARLCDS